MQVQQRCFVIDCTAPAVANGVCQTHYMRIKRHGSPDQTRPKDWGAREKHPLYKHWCQLRRNRSDVVCQRWLKDFWAFVADVKVKPDGKVNLMPLDQGKKIDVGNFYWSTPTASVEHRSSKAAAMKEWRAARLEANEDYFRDAEYQKRYGVSLEWYNERLAEQDGKCAICRFPETTKIRGKLIRLAVDHCHDTGKARALLCKECNGALGQLHHDPVRIAAALAYVEHHSTP